MSLWLASPELPAAGSRSACSRPATVRLVAQFAGPRNRREGNGPVEGLAPGCSADELDAADGASSSIYAHVLANSPRPCCGTSSSPVASYAASGCPTIRSGAWNVLADRRRSRRRALDAAAADHVVPQSPARCTVAGKDHRFGFLTDEGVDYVTEHPEMEVWAYSPLIQGSYDRTDRPFPEEYDHPGSTGRREALARVAERMRSAPRRWCWPGCCTSNRRSGRSSA